MKSSTKGKTLEPTVAVQMRTCYSVRLAAICVMFLDRNGFDVEALNCKCDRPFSCTWLRDHVKVTDHLMVGVKYWSRFQVRT